MFRRSSYAEVAAGNSGQPAPTRSGAFSHLASRSPSAHPQAAHSSRHRSHQAVDAFFTYPSMSPSWPRGPHPPPYASQYGAHHYSYGEGGQDPPDSHFFVPSYLKGSLYAEKLEEAYRAKMRAQRERRLSSPNPGSLSTSPSSTSLHKAAPSHRGMTYDIIERAPPVVDEPISPWPTRWNAADKYLQLELDEEGRQAKFLGPQKAHDEAASVRADHPMPHQCGIYYYEVTIVSKGKDKVIGIGFSAPKVSLTRIPGWEPESYAYHGDDGQSFSNTTSGKPYGPKFGTLDVIGCGVNFRTGTAFFTKNGHHLGTAFKDIKPDKKYFPIIGMKKPGETLKANFGQEPFIFDIDKMMRMEKMEIQKEISCPISPHISADTFSETDFIHSLIEQYLTHDGYVESARVFSEEVNEEARALANNDGADLLYVRPEEDLDAINRQKIRSAILEGDIDKALKHTNAYYPSVLRDNENIYFKLRCRKFIEMIRRTNELSKQLNSAPNPTSRRSTDSRAHNDEYDFEMELDEQLGLRPGDDKMDTEDGVHAEDAQVRYQKLTQETIEYGMVLKQEFANDPRREVKRALEDTFALIAYENEVESSLAPLLDKAGRVPVAEELNSAILVSLGKSSSSALERLTQQAEALVEVLAKDGGPGAFINVRRDFLE